VGVSGANERHEPGYSIAQVHRDTAAVGAILLVGLLAGGPGLLGPIGLARIARAALPGLADLTSTLQ
jgi:hypothetical protein